MTARKENFAREHYEREPGLPGQEWYTVDEAANYLRVSKRTIYLLIREGQLESYRVGKRGHRRFKREDLDQAMRKESNQELYDLNAVADPVLAELWDNEKDAEYDRI
jgi:excisionase family DNA binding protein